jgi:UDP-N-acetyl-D-mannosaminuronic acid dehydrogenase
LFSYDDSNFDENIETDEDELLGTKDHSVAAQAELILMKFDLSKMTVGILGMAFKADVDDTRSSLAFKLRKILLFKCKNVLISDPFVKDERLINQERLLQESDILIIGAPHGIYRNLETDKAVIDIWGLRSSGVQI